LLAAQEGMRRSSLDGSGIVVRSVLVSVGVVVAAIVLAAVLYRLYAPPVVDLRL
jgi:hypothetical protein